MFPDVNDLEWAVPTHPKLVAEHLMGQVPLGFLMALALVGEVQLVVRHPFSIIFNERRFDLFNVTVWLGMDTILAVCTDVEFDYLW